MSMTISNNDNDEQLFLIVLLSKVNLSLKKKCIDDLDDRVRNMPSIRLYNLKNKGQIALWVDDDITLLLKKQQYSFLCVDISKRPKPPARLSHYHELLQIKPRIVAKENICRYQQDAADCDKINREVMGKKCWDSFAGADNMHKRCEVDIKLQKKALEYKRFHRPARGCNVDVSHTSATIPVTITGNDDAIKKIKRGARLGFILKMPHDNYDDSRSRGRKEIFGKMQNYNGQSMKVNMEKTEFNESVRKEIRSGMSGGKFHSSIQFSAPKQNAKGEITSGQQDLSIGASGLSSSKIATKGIEAKFSNNENYDALPVKFEDTPDARDVKFYYNNEKVLAFSCRASQSSSGWCITPDSIKLHNFMIYADYHGEESQIKIMKESLDKIITCNIWQVLSGERVSLLPDTETVNVEWPKNCRLNSNQKSAVKTALGAQELCLIWGPPGTGKTEVISEIARQQSIRGKKTLIASQANLAVDNALGRLYDVSSDSVFAIRIAKDGYKLEKDDKEKIPIWENCGDFFSKYLCARIKAQEPSASPTVTKLRQKMLKRLESEIKPSNRMKREMVQMIKLYQKRISVVGSTLMGAGKKYQDKNSKTRKYEIFQRLNMKEGEEFDTIIVDEVSKALPMELFIPLPLGKNVVLVGDHKQLPPMLKMWDGDHLSLEEWFKKSGITKEKLDADYVLFEELWKRHDKDALPVRAMLTKQYRMHPEIQNLIQGFYTEKETGATLTCGLTKEETAKMTVTWDGPLANVHAAWVDTNSNANESRDGTSFYNNDEIRIIGSLLELLKSAPDLSVGVITFYGAQLRRLEEAYRAKFSRNFPKGLIFGTVDRFQGRECDVVLCSLVRKNQSKKIGFAEKPNRINVAFSRARRLLCIVGNSGHFCYEANTTALETYRKIFHQCKQLNGGGINRYAESKNS